VPATCRMDELESDMNLCLTQGLAR
jgi:hypothetical protein